MFVGDLVNEDKIILGSEKFAGISVKGHDPAKDGILAYLLAAEAVAACRTGLKILMPSGLKLLIWDLL
jgi:phosphomannomutase